MPGFNSDRGSGYLLRSSIPPLANEYSLVFVGDSYTARGVFSTVTDLEDANEGFSYWAKQLSNNRFWSPPSYNFGVVGVLTSSMLVNQMPSALGISPSVMVILGGRNDAQTGVSALPDTTPGTTTYNLRQMYEQCATAGAAVIAVKILSTAAAEWPNTTYELQAILTNRWIDQQALLRPNFYVVDCASVYDDASASTWQPKTGYVDSGDLTHPTLWGAYQIGNSVASVLNKLLADWRVSPRNPSDFFGTGPTGNTYGNVLVNTGWTGTAGSFSGTGASGTVGSGWQLNTANAFGVGCTASKGTGPDGRISQILWIGNTGTTGTAGAVKLISTAAGLVAGNFNAGDVIEASVDVVIGPTTTLNSVRLFMLTTENGTSFTTGAGKASGLNLTGYALPTDGNTGGGSPANSPLSYTIYTPRRTLTAAPTVAQLNIWSEFPSPLTGPTPIGGTLTFYSPTIRKVPPASI